MSSTLNVRVWKEVYDIYKEISDRYNIILSNLVSVALLRAAIEQIILTEVLHIWFDIDFNEARKIAEEVHKKALVITNNITIKAKEVKRKTRKRSRSSYAKFAPHRPGKRE